MTEFIDFKLGKEIEWLELNLLIRGRALSKAEITNISDDASEEDVDSWISELERREKQFYEPLYSIANNRISPLKNWSDIPEYFLCLYYAFYGANDYSGGTKLFENISANVLKNFINGDTYTLGFPENKRFNDYLDEIALNCFEERNMPAQGIYKDDGVDVVGYKTFNDGRGASLYILLQCAAGKHWASKKPINLNRWTNYILWYSENIIQSISTVEYVEQKNWSKHSSTYGMLIDRSRIYNFLYKEEVDYALREKVIRWCKTKIDAGL